MINKNMLKGKKNSAIFNKLDSKFKSKLENLFARRIPTKKKEPTKKTKKIKKIKRSKPIMLIKEEPIETIKQIETETVENKEINLSQEKNKQTIENIEIKNREIKNREIENREIKNREIKNSENKNSENSIILNKLIKLNSILIDREIENIQENYIIDRKSFFMGICVSFLILKWIF